MKAAGLEPGEARRTANPLSWKLRAMRSGVERQTDIYLGGVSGKRPRVPADATSSRSARGRR